MEATVPAFMDLTSILATRIPLVTAVAMKVNKDLVTTLAQTTELLIVP